MGLAHVIERMLGSDVSVFVHAYDGSHSGPRDADIELRVLNPRAMAYIAAAPGQLGLARAYVAGDLDLVGNAHTALVALAGAVERRPNAADVLALLRVALPNLMQGLQPPPQEVRLRGRKHSPQRDLQAIAHHYDLSNRFYERLLGPSMVYTCAVYPTADATLEEAQDYKHDLVARKLALRPGMRLLDVGCGWGGMVRHAARHYGVSALGVTLSRRQAEWASEAIERDGLAHLAQVRHADYREVREDGFDAISSIGLTEHIGRAQLPGYFARLYAKLAPGGRLLNHCITRPSNREQAIERRGFINRYVFPDGELSGPGFLMSLMHDHGFEVRHSENLREHYARTLAAWSANLDAHWDEAVAEVGEARARVWRLYLAGSQLGFERNGLQLHQVLGVKLDRYDSRMPLRPDWETVAAIEAEPTAEPSET